MNMEKEKSRIFMKATLTPQQVYTTYECRPVTQEDIADCALLMLEAYKGTIDYEGETLEDARREIKAIFNGAYGKILQSCSFLQKEKNQVRSACFVTFYEKLQLPLVAVMMTHPRYKNQGLGTQVLKTSMNALLDEGYTELCLVVTEGNLPAYTLYTTVGFSKMDEKQVK